MSKKPDYFDYAEDDYNGFIDCYNVGERYNFLAALAQEACEKYLKHLIDIYYKPKTDLKTARRDGILRTHSLQALMSFLKDEMGVNVTAEIYDQISKADGYIYSTTEPGPDSRLANKYDIERCAEAIKTTRNFALEYIQETDKKGMNNERENNRN